MSWICKNCETENADYLEFCEVCNSPRIEKDNQTYNNKPVYWVIIVVCILLGVSIIILVRYNRHSTLPPTVVDSDSIEEVIDSLGPNLVTLEQNEPLERDSIEGLGEIYTNNGLDNDSIEDIISDDTIYNSKSLNDIRFSGFKDIDWIDNDYIRTLRLYIDAYNNGLVVNSYLDPYRNVLKDKFVVYDVEPFIAGGLFIRIFFLNMPRLVFGAWVYSDVDVETESILDYDVRIMKKDKIETDFTKEKVLEIIKERPELKLW